MIATRVPFIEKEKTVSKDSLAVLLSSVRNRSWLYLDEGLLHGGTHLYGSQRNYLAIWSLLLYSHNEMRGGRELLISDGWLVGI